MSIISFDNIIAARASGNAWDWAFDGMTANQTPIAGAWYDLTSRIAQINRTVLSYTGFASSGANGAIMNAASTGAIPIPYCGGSYTRFLTSFATQVASIVGFSAVMLVDILMAAGPFTVPTSTGTTTPTAVSPALTRYNGTNGPGYAGNQLMISVGTLFGGTQGSFAITYTNQSGTQHTTTAFTPVTAAGTANRILQNGVTFGPPFIPLASGDTGIQNVVSFTLSGSPSSPTGTIYFHIVRPLLILPTLAANSWVERDITTTMDALIPLVSGSDSQHGCLAVLGLGNGTTASEMWYSLRTVFG